MIGLMSASCRKERTCECNTTETEVISGFGAQVNINNSSSSYSKKKQRRKEFKWSSDCFGSTNTSYNSGGNGPGAWTSVTTTERACELK